MSALFVKLTCSVHGDNIYVNLANVTSMFRYGDSTQINFMTTEIEAHVKETPHEIIDIQLSTERKKANLL